MSQPIKRCVHCGYDRLVKGAEEVSHGLDGRTFTSPVPAQICPRCGEAYFDFDALARYEAAIGVELANAGALSGDSLRFMRRALGLSVLELAGLLDVAAESWTSWESGAAPVERRSSALVGAMVLDRQAASSSTIDRLKALRAPCQLGKTVQIPTRPA